MQHLTRLVGLAVALIWLASAIGPASAQETPESPDVGACLPGTGYASGCDVDQDGDVDIFDVQLTAGRWSTSGVYTSGHTHWGETWTNATGTQGLRLEHTASTGFTYGIYGQSASSDGIGVAGRTTAASGSTVGVYGRSDSAGGTGVYGAAVNGSSINFGVYGYSSSSAGYAGYFTGSGADTLFVQNYSSGRAIQAYSPNDTGVWAKTDAGLAGVDGWNSSTTGRGVSGYASAASGLTHGVWGQSASSSGTGVLGWANAASGNTTGVYGESNSTDGRGVFGATTAASGYTYGVYGQSASSDGRGVWGTATATSGTAIGVYGLTNSSSGYAGYFVGRTQVIGDFTAIGTKSFLIDHPLDPANQYLYHYSLEGPAPFNLYRGTATLDSHGAASVELPVYFEAINSDFSYQLTAIGAAMPNLHVAREIEDNTFRIAGGVAGMKVSWQVTAVRNDAWVRDHGIKTETAKPDAERGLYLYPQGYSQPAELGLDYQRDASSTDRPQAQAMVNR